MYKPYFDPPGEFFKPYREGGMREAAVMDAV
jgi:hypothetical protein